MLTTQLFTFLKKYRIYGQSKSLTWYRNSGEVFISKNWQQTNKQKKNEKMKNILNIFYLTMILGVIFVKKMINKKINNIYIYKSF